MPTRSGSQRTQMDRFWAKVDKSGECWEWTAFKDDCGYGCFGLNGRRERAHRVALILDGVDIPLGMCVCHHCDNPGCVNPDHLFIASHTENMKDMKNKGRGINGEKNGNARLTDQDILRMFDLLKCGVRQVDIAKYFNVGTGHMSRIKNGTRWNHLQEKY